MRAKITTRLVRQVASQATVYEIWDTDIPGFVLRVWPSGQASYYLVYRTRDSRRVRYRIGPMGAMTVAQARDLAQQYAARTVAGEDIQATKQKAREDGQYARLQTLGGFLEHKYAPCYVLRGQRSAEVSKSSDGSKRILPS